MVSPSSGFSSSSEMVFPSSGFSPVPSHGVLVHCRLLPVSHPMLFSFAITSSLVHMRSPWLAQIEKASSKVFPFSHESKFHSPLGGTLRVKRVAATPSTVLTTHFLAGSEFTRKFSAPQHCTESSLCFAAHCLWSYGASTAIVASRLRQCTPTPGASGFLRPESFPMIAKKLVALGGGRGVSVFAGAR